MRLSRQRSPTGLPVRDHSGPPRFAIGESQQTALQGVADIRSKPAGRTGPWWQDVRQDRSFRKVPVQAAVAASAASQNKRFSQVETAMPRIVPQRDSRDAAAARPATRHPGRHRRHRVAGDIACEERASVAGCSGCASIQKRPDPLKGSASRVRRRQHREALRFRSSRHSNRGERPTQRVTSSHFVEA